MNSPTPNTDALRACESLGDLAPGSHLAIVRVYADGTTGNHIALLGNDRESAVAAVLAEVGDLQAELAALRTATHSPANYIAQRLRKLGPLQAFADDVRTALGQPRAEHTLRIKHALSTLDAALRGGQ